MIIKDRESAITTKDRVEKKLTLLSFSYSNLDIKSCSSKCYQYYSILNSLIVIF